MPSNKDKVTSYLEDTHFQAIKGFCEENNYSYSEGVSHLIQKQLIEKTETPEALVANQHYDQRIESLEGHVGRIIETIRCHAERAEKLEHRFSNQFFILQDETFNLKTTVSALTSQPNVKKF